MKIGYDAKRAVCNMTGLGNYSRLVIEQIAERFPLSELFLYTPKLKDSPRLEPIRNLPNIEFRLPPPQGFKGSLWRTFGVTNNLKADGVDIYHGLSNELPLNISNAGIPSVVTIHDVIYRRMPQCYNAIDRLIYDFKYGHSCRNATRIIAVSERTRLDVAEYYDIPLDKIDVVYQGCDNSFKKVIPLQLLEESRRRLALPDNYILQVGTIEERKNLELTVRALPYVPADFNLLVVGRDRKGYLEKVMKIARDCGVAQRITVRNDIGFTDLPAINQLAEVIVYPSHYEGFGIPILEGLESGRPVIAATGSCLEEAGGDAAIYVSPSDVRGMADAINAILSGSADIPAMIGRGKKHASKFDNAKMGEKIMAVYEKTIQEAFRLPS